jgi:hypothetical protein
MRAEVEEEEGWRTGKRVYEVAHQLFTSVIFDPLLGSVRRELREGGGDEGGCFAKQGCANHFPKYKMAHFNAGGQGQLQPTVILLRDGTDDSQGKAQLISNINACQAVAEAVRTTLGPRGMDKLIHDGRTVSWGMIVSQGESSWHLYFV